MLDLSIEAVEVTFPGLPPPRSPSTVFTFLPAAISR